MSTYSPGNYRDNESMYLVAKHLAANGKRNDAIRLLEMLESHIESTGRHLSAAQDPSKKHLLPYIKGDLARLRHDSMAELGDERRGRLMWRFRQVGLQRAAAVVIYLTLILGLSMTITAEKLTITIPV